jgi:hypothetical protein
MTHLTNLITSAGDLLGLSGLGLKGASATWDVLATALLFTCASLLSRHRSN